jgi:cytoskeleton protein RodZ
MARKTNATESIPALASDTNTPQDLYMTQTEAQIDFSSQSRSRCGGALRAEREKQTLSIQDVANKLRLSPKQIEALEADNFAGLPEPTIVRGFIRNYAKQLKINAEPLLDAYSVIVPSNTPYELTVKPTSNMHVSSKDKPKVSSYIFAGLAGLLALGVWLFYQNYIAKPNPTVPSASTSKVEPLPEPALPAAERSPELQASTELMLPAADGAALPAAAALTPATLPAAIGNAPVTAPVDTNSTISNTLAPSIPAVAAPLADSTSVITNTGQAKLEINASQETWVSVTDADGKQIYDKIIFAGSRESVEAKPPLNVVVGNAGGASLNLNGKAVDLGPHTRNNVARIKLE